MQLQDDAWYYVLQDLNGLKHFLPAGYYRNYGFQPGDEISCKIEKINCTGRIFLEPKHPTYAEGEIYEFEFISYSETDKEKIVIVREIGGNTVDVPIYGNDKIDLIEEKRIRCIVKSIKKGIPNLEISPDSI